LEWILEIEMGVRVEWIQLAINLGSITAENLVTS
jgi:hypothetical protein